MRQNKNNCFVALVVIVVAGLYSGSSVAAQTWYSRPYTAPNDYGVADGATYQTAWNGLGNINWNLIAPGDTLLICGTHPDPEASPGNGSGLTNDTQLVIQASGTTANPVEIRFDCPIPDDPGTIISAARQYLFDPASSVANMAAGWHDAGGGIWFACTFGATSTYIEFEYKADGGNGNFRRLTRASDTPGVVPAEWQSQDGIALHTSQVNPACPFGNSTFYYKPTAGVGKTAVYVTANRQVVIIDGEQAGVSGFGKNDIRLIGRPDLDPGQAASGRDHTLVGGGILVRDGVRDVMIDHQFITYSAEFAIEPGEQSLPPNPPVSGCQGIEISYNRISDSRAGIYNNSNGDPSSCNGLHIHHNYVLDINQDKYWSFDDKHGIQIEAGDNHIIEFNHIERVGSHGIGFDGKSTAQMNNNIVRYNFVRDVSSVDNGFNEQAFVLEGTNNNYVPDNQKNNRVYNNIFVNGNKAGIFISTAGVPTTGYGWAFNNNVVLDTAEDGIILSDNTSAPTGVYLKNSSVTGSGDQHVEHRRSTQQADWTGIYIDENLYFPDGTTKFTWKNTPYDFAGWQAVTAADPTANALDAGSQLADPLYVNTSSTFSVAQDFRLTEFSPAIDAGTFDIAIGDSGPLSIEPDFDGNPIYGLPDVGAFEYQPTRLIGVDGVDTTAEIRLYGDGRFRNKTAPGATTAVLNVTSIMPVGGWPGGQQTRWYMDIQINAWQNPGELRSITTTSYSNASMAFSFGDLPVLTPYVVQRDGVNYSAGVSDVGGTLVFATALSGTTTTPGSTAFSIIPGNSGADGDNDGLSDAFEQCYDNDCTDYNPYHPANNPSGTDLDAASADTDRDGVSDAQEIAAQSDPLDPASIPILPDGDITEDGIVDIRDVLAAVRIVTGLQTPTTTQFGHGDVAPLSAGVPAPDGTINAADLMLIQKKALGLISF